MKWNIIAICIAACFWAVEGIILMPRLFNLEVPFIVLMVHLLGFVVLNIFFFNRIKKAKGFSFGDFAWLFLIGLFGGALGTLAIVKALTLVQFQPLSIVLLLQKLQPVFAIMLAMLLLKEKPYKRFYLWAVIAIAASYTLTFGFGKPNLAAGSGMFYAAIFATLAALFFGAGTVMGRKMALKHDFITITYYRYGFTTLIMLLYVALFSSFQFSSATGTNWLIFVIIPLTTGVAGMLLYYFGLKKVTATVSTMCELSFPVSAVVLDYFVNGSMLSLVQIISALVMVFSITMITLKK